MAENLLAPWEAMAMLDIIHATNSCQTMAVFLEQASLLQDLLACQETAFCWKAMSAKSMTEMPTIVNVGFPDEFFTVVDQYNLMIDNPIAIRGMQQEGLQSWQEIFSVMPPSPQLLEVKHSFELQNGYSFSLSSKRPQAVTMISLNSYDKAEVGRWQFILERLMPHFNLALNSLLVDEQKVVPKLTKREVEVLCWLKEGKTSWEISVILSISERTINFHVNNLKTKLNAGNRLSAVAQAMHLGLVHS